MRRRRTSSILPCFCDSDDTHTASISYFAYVRLGRR
jgi:hypothetical protein